MLILRTICLLAVLLLPSWVRADDWPMWRYDAYRSAASTEQLPEGKLAHRWTREFARRKPAWDDTLNRDLMSYDRVLEPIVKSGRVFIGFNDSDKLAAYDLATGKSLWSYYCDGPVRLAPVAWQEYVYCASDDGFLHCLEAATGKLVWKFRGGPAPASGEHDATGLGRLSLGNSRLISAWPMRGGPVIRDDKLYLAASIWPFMGTFIYALDAKSGRVLWCNDETGAQYIRQPHSAPAFAGVAPQGALVATRDALIVPGGRSVPAVFDRATGALKYFELNAGGKGTGGSFVVANDRSWFVHTRERGTREFALDTGLKTAFVPNEPVLAGDIIYASAVEEDQPSLRAYKSDSKEELWRLPINAAGDVIQVGQHLLCVGKANQGSSDNEQRSTIQVVRLDADLSKAGRVVDQCEVQGQVVRLLAASGHVLAVTLEGPVHALTFGSADAQPVLKEQTHSERSAVADSASDPRAKELFKRGAPEGYAVMLGAEDPKLVQALSASSFVEVSLFDPDAARVDALRREFDRSGDYGRITAHESSLGNLFLPPYLAHHLWVSPAQSPQLAANPALLAKVYESVRPYGGVLGLMTNDETKLAAEVRAAGLVNAQVETVSGCVIVQRVGSLPGSGFWTHQYGNMANTIKSDDQLVKLPLGLLWYGGVSHEDVLPRHGHGPPEQVVGGRLFIEGVNSLTARDVYTGRVLWQREFNDLGTHDVYFDDTYKETPLDPAYNQVHIPGANGRGTNYVVTEDRIYILEKSTCHVLDTASGKTLTAIELPQSDPSTPREWGYIGVLDDVLIGGVGFAQYRARQAIEDDSDKVTGSKAGFGAKSLDRAASLSLVGFDRHTGKQLWQVPAVHSFWHNGIVGGNGKIFALDRNPKPVEEFLKRRGKSNPKTYRIVALDAKTGEMAWQSSRNIFGSWLGYSADKDLLLQAGASATDRLSSEVGQGMAVLSGANGQIVWEKSDLKYSGPCVLHNDLIITNANAYTESAGAFHLKDGSQKMTKNPLTGRYEPWKITRAYGCNSIVASENLLTFRSGAAAFYDMLTEAGTGNLGGFRSGCSSNLIAADGVLNAPDYTRTCSCSYQNQTSLALVHMPELDAWTISNSAVLEPKQGRARELGFNLAAPGDRRAPSGVMWLEYPTVSGDGPNFKVTWEGNARLFQDHPSAQPTSDLPWITSSGIEGLTALHIGLVAQPRNTLKSGWPIAHVEDDAEENAQGIVDLDSSGLELQGKDKASQWIGLRFEDIRLARGSKIRSAHLQLTSKAVTEAGGSMKLFVEDNANSQRFSARDRDISSRSRLAESVTWEVPAWKTEGSADKEQLSPDLTSLLQSIVNRDDWQPGQSISILLQGSGSHAISAFRAADSNAPKLIVDADEVELISESDRRPLPYRVNLYFGLPRDATAGTREFEVSIGDQRQPVHLDAKDTRTARLSFARVELSSAVDIQFHSQTGLSLISGVELQQLSNDATAEDR